VAAAPRGDAPQSQPKVNVEKEDLPF
jgi:hypothetical protein